MIIKSLEIRLESFTPVNDPIEDNKTYVRKKAMAGRLLFKVRGNVSGAAKIGGTI
jgi:hypothetical protein